MELTGGCEQGVLPLDTTVAQALSETNSTSTSAAPARPPPSNRQFSDFVLTNHLHSASLRLVYLPFALDVCFQHIPGVREEWRRRIWIGGEMTAGEVVEALVEEMGVRKVVVHGAKTARVEYVLQVAAASGGESLCESRGSWS